MATLTPDEQDLFNAAQAALPSWYAPAGEPNHHLVVFAKMMGRIHEASQDWLTAQAFIGFSDAATDFSPDWTAQHAANIRSSRMLGETQAMLRERLRTVDDALTADAIIAAANAILTAAGVVGTAAIVELPRDQMYLGKNGTWTGTGGTFGAGTFSPSAMWSRPPFKPSTADGPAIEHRLVISGAASPGNNGTFVITGIDGNSATFVNGSAVAGVDASCTWTIRRFRGGRDMTTRAKSFLGRGYRIGTGTIGAFVLILPFGTTETIARSISEMLRNTKAAGMRAIVERRATPV